MRRKTHIGSDSITHKGKIRCFFKGLKENNGWTVAEYSATWIYGYDFMLDAVQTIIDTDFQDKLQRVATAEIAEARDIEHALATVTNNNRKEGN